MAQMTSPRVLGLAIACALACVFPAANARGQEAVGYQQALEAGWAGRYGDALRQIDLYLIAHPDDRAAQLDRARFYAWRGDYAAAMDALARFPADDVEAIALRARIAAWADRRDTALALNTPLYAAAPGDYDHAWTQALALRQGEWPQQALPALATVQAAKPDSPDTITLARAVRLPLFSSISVPVSLYSDSDHIQIRSTGVEASLRLGDRWHLLAGGTRRVYSARAGGPFTPVGGGDSVGETRIGGGIRYAFSPDTAFEAWLGRSTLNDHTPATGDATIGHVSLAQHVNDNLSYVLTADRDRVDASPRSLAVLRDGIAADVRWTPNLRDTLATRVAFSNFDDDNRRQAFLGDYRHATYRGDKVLVDVGGQIELQHNSRNTGNGYYSPDRYIRVAPQASAYVTFSEEAGLYLSASLGAQRDETFNSWKRAADLDAELTLGIFTHWQLVARAAYSQQLNQLGRYEGTTVGLQLRYRFCEFSPSRCPMTH